MGEWAHLQLGLDATYTLDSEPTGVAVYSREILFGLADLHPNNEINAYYRLHRFRRSLNQALPPNVTRRVLVDSFAPGVSIFHGLNQRLPRRKRGRFVATFHDLFVMTSEYSTPEFRARFTEQAREAAERADMIIAVSAFTASQVHELLQVEPSRIRVVHHGVHSAPQGEASQPMILHTGAIQERKNIYRLIEAFEQLPPEWKLVLAGGIGFGAERILERIKISSRSRDIQVTGYISNDELSELYRQASVFAFPSLDEGFGMPILEAMIRGIPVVTSRRSATEEVAGNAAILIDPQNTDDIAAGIFRLISSSEERETYRQKGIERAHNFTWKRAVFATYDVYRQLDG